MIDEQNHSRTESKKTQIHQSHRYHLKMMLSKYLFVASRSIHRVSHEQQQQQKFD